MTSEGLGEMLEGYSADTCAAKFPVMLRGGGRAEGLACAYMEARSLIGMSRIFGTFSCSVRVSASPGKPDLLLV